MLWGCQAIRCPPVHGRLDHEIEVRYQLEAVRPVLPQSGGPSKRPTGLWHDDGGNRGGQDDLVVGVGFPPVEPDRDERRDLSDHVRTVFRLLSVAPRDRPTSGG